MKIEIINNGTTRFPFYTIMVNGEEYCSTGDIKKAENLVKLLSIGVVSGSYGCPNCGSKNIEEIGNNHHQTKDEMEYLEYCKCLKCKHEFVE